MAIGTASILDDEPDLTFCGACSGPVGEDGRCGHCEAGQCDGCGRWDVQAEDVAAKLPSGETVQHRACSGCRAEAEREQREKS